jgi:hypothetical protein
MMIKCKEKAKPGQRRLVRRFAIIPIRIRNYWVFLQYYWTLEQFSLYNTKQWDLVDYYITKPDNTAKDEL